MKGVLRNNSFLSLSPRNMFQKLEHFSLADVSIQSVVLAGLVVLLVALYYYSQTKDALPGPIGIPILGYWPFLDRYKSHIQLGKMKKKYGDIFGINIAGQLFVNLGTAKAVREAHITNSECFAKRYETFGLLTAIFGDSIVFSKSEQWQTLRKFFLNIFKERGMTSIKSTLDVPMGDAMISITEELGKANGQPVSVVDLLHNQCCKLFRESLFPNSDVTVSDVKAVNNYYEVISQTFSAYNLLITGKVAKYLIFPFSPSVKLALNHKKSINKVLSNIIKRQKDNMEGNDSIVTAFFKEKEERKKKGDPTYEHFTEETLIGSLMQFVGDGALSASVFVSVFFKSLLENPDEQEKIFKEIEEMVGPNRQPSIDDKPRMPYTTAFMHEVLRTNDFFPFFPSLECTKETTLGGYKIPKGSITLVNMWSAHNDPDTYENPDKFDPSRFIPVDGKQRIEHPITFGVGKRSCLGEGFVMIQTFLFLTTLIKNFRIVKADVNKKHKSTFELLRSKDLLICALPRNK